MTGITAWVNVVVDGKACSLPLFFDGDLLDPVVAAYFACSARAGLSRAALASRSRAVGAVVQACGGRPDWLAGLPGLLAAAAGASEARSVVASAWEFMEHLADAHRVPRGLLDELLEKAGTRARGGSRWVASSFLCHLSATGGRARSTSPNARARLTLRPAADEPSKVPAACFPEEHIADFFITGLRREYPLGRARAHDAAGRLVQDYDVRSLLYFLLLAFGCLRRSEPLHLFGSDIGFDFGSGRGAVVWLWHPESGPAPDGSGRTREDYLREEFGIQPRTLDLGSAEVGWKNLMLDEAVPGIGMRTRVQWLLPEIAMLFWRLNRVYVELVRPRALGHPFHFVSLANNSFGQPWTNEGARSGFETALEALGLQPSAGEGLCMHGWRHRAKRWMDQLGLSSADKQQALHQNTSYAQEDYGRAGPVEVAAELERAARHTGCPAGAAAGRAPTPDACGMADIGRAIARHFGEAYFDLD